MAVHLALLKGQGLGTGLYELVSPALTAAGGCRYYKGFVCPPRDWFGLAAAFAVDPAVYYCTLLWFYYYGNHEDWHQC